MPPHHALTSSDVLDEILKGLTYHDKNVVNVNLQGRMVRRDLLAASLTCKAWKDKGLDLLWNRLSSLTPLLMLLPGLQRIDGKMVFAWLECCVAGTHSLLLAGHHRKTRSLYIHSVRLVCMSRRPPIIRHR